MKRTTEFVDSICILMMILGLIGNVLGLIVFSSRKFRRSTYGRLAIASLIINLLCVFRYSLLLHSVIRRWITYKVGQRWFYCKLYRLSSCLRVLSSFLIVIWTYERYSYVTNNFQLISKNKCQFALLTIISLSIIVVLTGPNVYFYLPQQISLIDDESSNSSEFNEVNSPMICALKSSISSRWLSFLVDVRFGLNYTTFRSIFSEMIPSILVVYFNIAIIIRVIQSEMSFSRRNSSLNFRSSHVHNRPRTSWMNIVLIIHSCLFVFSSLTATLVHWTTSDALLAYWISVLILANCSLNFYVYCLSGKSFRSEIRKLLISHFRTFCFSKCCSQREEIRLTSNSYRKRTTFSSSNQH